MGGRRGGNLDDLHPVMPVALAVKLVLEPGELRLRLTGGHPVPLALLRGTDRQPHARRMPQGCEFVVTPSRLFGDPRTQPNPRLTSGARVCSPHHSASLRNGFLSDEGTRSGRAPRWAALSRGGPSPSTKNSPPAVMNFRDIEDNAQ